MDPAIYIAIFVPLFIVLFEENKKKKIIKNIINPKSEEEKKLQMLEFAKKFMGKECYIYTINNTFKCVIKEVADNALLLETKNSTDVVNLDFVLRISEINKHKSGK